MILVSASEYFSASLQNPLKITTPGYPWPHFWRDSISKEVKLEILGAMSNTYSLFWSVSPPYAMLKCFYAGLGSINTNYWSHKNFTVQLISNQMPLNLEAELDGLYCIKGGIKPHRRQIWCFMEEVCSSQVPVIVVLKIYSMNRLMICQRPAFICKFSLSIKCLKEHNGDSTEEDSKRIMHCAIYIRQWLNIQEGGLCLGSLDSSCWTGRAWFSYLHTGIACLLI